MDIEGRLLKIVLIGELGNLEIVVVELKIIDSNVMNDRLLNNKKFILFV